MISASIFQIVTPAKVNGLNTNATATAQEAGANYGSFQSVLQGLLVKAIGQETASTDWPADVENHLKDILENDENDATIWTQINELFEVIQSLLPNDQEFAPGQSPVAIKALSAEILNGSDPFGPKPIAADGAENSGPPNSPVLQIMPKRSDLSLSAPQSPSTPAPQSPSTPASQSSSTPAPQSTSTPVPQSSFTPAPQSTSTPAPQNSATNPVADLLSPPTSVPAAILPASTKQSQTGIVPSHTITAPSSHPVEQASASQGFETRSDMHNAVNRADVNTVADRSAGAVEASVIAKQQSRPIVVQGVAEEALLKSDQKKEQTPNLTSNVSAKSGKTFEEQSVFKPAGSKAASAVFETKNSRAESADALGAKANAKIQMQHEETRAQGSPIAIDDETASAQKKIVKGFRKAQVEGRLPISEGKSVDGSKTKSGLRETVVEPTQARALDRPSGSMFEQSKTQVVPDKPFEAAHTLDTPSSQATVMGKTSAAPDQLGVDKQAAATSPDASLGRSTATPTSTFDQLVSKATYLVKKGRSEAKIELKPAILGNVRMQIATERQQVTLKIVTELAVTKEMIESNLSQLKTDLQVHGLDVEKIDISLSDQSEGRNEDRWANQRQGGKKSSSFRPFDESDKQNQDRSKSPKSKTRSRGQGVVDYFA